MSKSTAQNVVHESETQRQFVRLPIPAQAIIESDTYLIKDLSSGGASLLDVKKAQKEGTNIQVKLLLPFSSFSMQITLDAQVKYYIADDKVMGLQFMGLSTDQVSLLNHVVKSFMAGEIVKSNDLLNVAARENFTKPRGKKIAQSGTPVVDLKRQIPGLILVSVLGLVALSFIGANIYENMFVLKTNNAFVQGDTMQVRANEQGVYVSKLDADAKSVKNRQEIGTVNGNDIKSPCDCSITEIYRQDGEFVVAGEPILALTSTTSKPWITAIVKPEEARKLSLNGKANIAIAGTKVEMSGKIISIKSDAGDVSGFAGASRQIQIRIAADQNVPSELIDRPARVIFDIR